MTFCMQQAHLHWRAHRLLAHLALVHVARRLVVVAVRRQPGHDAQHGAGAGLRVRVRRARGAARAAIGTPEGEAQAGKMT